MGGGGGGGCSIAEAIDGVSGAKTINYNEREFATTGTRTQTSSMGSSNSTLELLSHIKFAALFNYRNYLFSFKISCKTGIISKVISKAQVIESENQKANDLNSKSNMDYPKTPDLCIDTIISLNPLCPR